MATKSVEKFDKKLTDEELGELTSFADVAKALSTNKFATETMLDYGHGFSLLKDKEQLVGKPFVIVQWAFWESKRFIGKSFVAMFLFTKSGEKYIVCDGSTGIYEQLLMATNSREKRGATEAEAHSGLPCMEGLSMSEYDYVDPNTGEVTRARTFYLA